MEYNSVEEMSTFYPEVDFPIFNGFDDCVVGVITRFGMEQPIICYDRNKVIANLMAQGMPYGEAEEYFAYNIEGAWIGDGTPCFIEKITPPDTYEETREKVRELFEEPEVRADDPLLTAVKRDVFINKPSSFCHE